MENASKALLIAAGVLIAVLLLSLFSFTFLRMSENTGKIYEMMEMSKYTKFNQQFLDFQNKERLTVQDIVTIINLAKDNNENEKFPTVISVFKGYTNSNDLVNRNTEELLNNELGSSKTYTCIVEFGDDSRGENSKLVKTVRIFE